MDFKNTWITMGVFLLVAVLVWVGFSVYFSFSNVDVDPNAASYTQVLPGTFDTSTLDKVMERVNNLPISPETFIKLGNTSTTN